MEDNISKIKDKVDIVDLVGSYVKLQKSGINYKARCPFHNEKSGSFFVSPERQIWHCFGCGLGGDIFGFVKQIEGVEFPEALRILATRAGIELSQFRANPEFQSAKNKLYEISDLATKFFGKQLHESTMGKKALEYLKNRGLTDESIEKFKLGYAPESWDGLGNFLARDYDIKHIAEAGLLVKKEQGGYFDRFRSRIMFPIFDMNNQVVGFTGRVFGEGEPKYMNVPQTAIYDKSRILYGMNFAKLDMRRKNKALIVEGNMDVIMSHQAGATHAVASSGTAMTSGHLQIIKRYTDNLDLCFDADSAGSMATERGVDLALARGFNVGIVTTSEKDPADYIQKYGNADFAEKSQPFMEYFFETSRKTLDLSTGMGKKLFSQKLLPLVASMANKIEQAHWVQEIATAMKVKDEIVRAELSHVPQNSQRTASDEDVAHYTLHDAPKLDIFQESLLSLISKKPELVAKLTEADKAFLPKTTPMQAQFVALKAEEYWKDFDDAELDVEFAKLLNHLKKRTIVAQLENLEYEIKEAERQGDKTRLAQLVATFTKTSGQL
ncbi:MAG: DNA primase [Patescibacteria group bacterium]|mgnify:CR=1 FL=1